jgi:hypothetical protein
MDKGTNVRGSRNCNHGEYYLKINLDALICTMEMWVPDKILYLLPNNILWSPLLDRPKPGVTGNNVLRNKCPGNKLFYCNDFNLRSLVSITMHNPSTNNKVGHFSRGITITVTPAY